MAASDLQEVQNVVEVTFGEEGAEQINSWAKQAAGAYGLSEKAAKQYTGTVGAMLKSMGLAGDVVLDMSKDITGLAADFASFYNLSHEDAFTKIRAGLSGETEPLKQLGINMSIANLEAYALSQGIETAYEKMSQAEQVMLRYNYLMSVSADAQGDFARTSDSFANSMRIIQTNGDRISTSIGRNLLPTVTKATSEIGALSGELADAMDVSGIEGGIQYLTTEMPVATSAVAGLAAAFGSMQVLNPVTKLVKSYDKASGTLAAKLAKNTAAELASTGALKAKEIAAGVATKKITLLTGAQAAYNAVLKANPIFLVAGAIGALVGSVMFAERAMVKANPEMREMEENALALRKANEELADSIENSAASYEKTMSGISENTVAAESLINKLADLSQGYSGTNMEQQQMQSLCDKLNASVEGLNVSFDKQTGQLNMSAEAMKEYAKNAAEAAIQQAAVERLTELYVEQAEAQYALKKAEEERAQLTQKTSEYLW